MQAASNLSVSPKGDKEIPCPICGQPVKLEEHPQLKSRLVAYHNCRPGMGMIEVYQTDNPAYKPTKESEDK